MLRPSEPADCAKSGLQAQCWDGERRFNEMASSSGVLVLTSPGLVSDAWLFRVIFSQAPGSAALMSGLGVFTETVREGKWYRPA